jgi:hypothetical protein
MIGWALLTGARFGHYPWKGTLLLRTGIAPDYLACVGAHLAASAFLAHSPHTDIHTTRTAGWP